MVTIVLHLRCVCKFGKAGALTPLGRLQTEPDPCSRRSRAWPYLARARQLRRAGGTYLSTDLETRPAPEAGLELLSNREHEVFALLAKGATPKQIALALGISDKTAYLHRATLRAKLGARSDLDLHRIALERGLL